MGVHSNQAWVVPAVDDQDVKKALVVAGSLRRVKTTRKIIALFTATVSEESRLLLREKFDLALLIDQKTPDGVSPTDFAKLFAFSLTIFVKCVYLSTSTMVLQNCDEIFNCQDLFQAFVNPDDETVDTSVFLFTPSIRRYQAMKKLAGNDFSNSATFSNNFGKWLQNEDPTSPQILNERYNMRISLGDQLDAYDGLQSDLVVVNFETMHPIQLVDQSLLNSTIKELGMIEAYMLDRWLTIYGEEVGNVNCSSFAKTYIADNEPVAIVGMSGRFPGANSLDEFWQLLIEGREGIQLLPSNRWTRDTCIMYQSNREVAAGFLNIPIDEFDAKFFGLSPKEAVFLDPQQRLLHEVSWEALEDAGIDPLSLRSKHVGVFVGSWLQDYKDIVVRSPEMDFYRMYMGNSIASLSARLSYFLGTTGPSIATESGCSSAIVAVDMAFNSLRQGHVDLAVTGGVNLFIHPFDPSSMLSFVVSPDSRCHTFDEKANGFGRAEACSVLVLKRYSDALKDGDNIWGLIRGSALSQEGVSKSMGTPTVQCEALAMKLALKEGNVLPDEVSFVEAHGTATVVGDPMEVSALTQVFASETRTKPLVIGSVKTNIGHTESVSGICGMIKTLLAMKHEIIPKHLNFETLNPEINLDVIPAKIPVDAEPWPRVPGKPRIAGVSSFGISGTDGHVVIQEAPTEEESRLFQQIHLMNYATRPLHFMKLSAKSMESMEELVSRHQLHLQRSIEEGIDFADYAHSANTGRAAFNHRAFVIAKDGEEALEILAKKSFASNQVQGQGVANGKLCFLFTGQGSQYLGMAKQLYETSPDVIWSEVANGNDVNSTLYSQTSIFCVEYSLLRLWQSWGVTPDYVLGHSLGEFAAAVAAGALSLKRALHLVAERSRLIHALPQGKMIVVRTDKRETDKLLKEFTNESPHKWLDYAAINSFDQTVLAGETGTVQDFAMFCEKSNVKTVILAATHAFHSRHMDNMLEEYKKTTSTALKVHNRTFKYQYISGVTGKLVEDVSNLVDCDYWLRHTRDKVSFIDACKTAKSEGCTFFLEVGPHPVLSALVLANVDDSSIVACSSLHRKQGDWIALLGGLGKLFLSEWSGAEHINWKGFDAYSMRKRVALPLYPFQRKKVWAEIYPVPTRVHPLLGAFRENASSITMFENLLGATSKFVPYLQDHVIGNTVVLPGAAFLEMCLSGGYAHVQGVVDEFVMPRRPITLKDLKIESPLGLFDSRARRLQVVVELEKDEDGASVVGYRTKVYHWEQQGDDDDCVGGTTDGYWVSHAQGNFMPVVSETVESLVETVNINEIQETWEETSQSQEFYKKLPEIGLRFGPAFQSLQKGWKNGTNDKFLLSVKVPEDAKAYIAHPALVDAMFQAAILWKGAKDPNGVSKKLHVPVAVQEFIYWRGSHSTTRYIYCCKDSRSDAVQISLIDQDGEVLMTLSGVDFIETTVSVVESVIQQQGNKVPAMWEEIFRHRPGPLELAVDYSTLDDSGASLVSEDVLAEAIALNKLDSAEEKIYRHLDRVTICYFCVALFELGWAPQLGETFQLEMLMGQLNITETNTNFVRFFMNCLTKDGYLLSPSKDEYVVKVALPGHQEMSSKIKSESFSKEEMNRGDYRTINEIGVKLTKILRGELHPLAVLFPENASSKLADSFYETITNAAAKCGDMVFRSMLERRFASFLDKQSLQKRNKIRILEVGAGTGMQTGRSLELLNSYEAAFEYHYTDISAAFFVKAEEKFEKYRNKMRFLKLDIEQDPLDQGFCPGYYDVVIAAEVLHATRNIKETLGNIRMLMRDGACLQILETTQKDRRLTFIFGLLEVSWHLGYWRFEDFDLRPDHATLSVQTWQEMLCKCGFERVVAIGAYWDVHSGILGLATDKYYPQGLFRRFPAVPVTKKPVWVIFGNGSSLQENLLIKLVSLDRDVKVLLPEDEVINKFTSKEGVDETFGNGVWVEGVLYMWGLSSNDENDSVLERDQKKLVEPFLCVCQYLWDNQKSAPKSYIITRGLYRVDDASVLDPAPSTLVGVAKVLRSETTVHNKCIDLPSDRQTKDMADYVFLELWYHFDEEETVTFRGSDQICKRLSPRFSMVRGFAEPLALPKGSDRFQLVLPETKMIHDLEFTFLPCYTLAENEIEIKVKANALNFRDLFAVLKPDPQFDSVNAIGTDFSGVVTAVGSNVSKRTVGEAVFGCNYNDDQALPSHIKMDEERVIALPDNLTFAEAAALPAVFSTAYYCLVTVGKINANDTVLIHTGSGGVGLVAIQIAQHYGCKKIISTAGSERKRAYLRSLGVHHVFHSRNTQYQHEIMKVTEGAGVDLVLNSLTSEGFKEATLECSAKNARFVEMSKLSIWKKEQVLAVRPDVEYTVADLVSLKEDTWRELLNEMKERVNEGVAKPMPYVRFDAVNIRTALTFMQRARHIGKIVTIMPEVKLEGSKFRQTTPLFNDRSTYMITGGITGGIGLETAKFMLNQGAKHLILVGRNQPTDKTNCLLSTWRSEGYNVQAWQCDVGDYKQMEQLFVKMKDPSSGFPPLRGVQHAAGVLHDATIPNQSWEKFDLCFASKVKGSWNLHHLTKDLNLEHFVFYSSLAAVFGTPGQANHCAGNFYEDSLTHYRDSQGLPATTINWGPWGQVGVATEIEIPGFRPLSTAQGIAALDTVLRTNRVQTGVMNVESFSVFAKYIPRIKIYIDDKSLFSDTKVMSLYTLNSEQFWEEVDSVEEREEKEDIFKKYIKIMIRAILKMDPEEPIDDNVELQSLGVDSLMMLEMKNGLQNLFGQRMTVNANELKGCNTLQLLACKLVDILLSGASKDEVLPTPEELQALIEEDILLPKSIDSNIAQALPGVGSPSQIKTLLITGITGNLGPYMLRRVVNMPQIARIVCLVRKRGKLSSMERLQLKLAENGLLSELPNLEEKVECVEGDIGQPRFGMSEENYESLADSMDGVIHCAVKMDLMQCYRRTAAQDKFHVRTVNVHGTKNVIEFATFKKRKLVLHASTYGVIYTVNEKTGSLSEEWEERPPPGQVPPELGYIISKCISEQLMRQAVQNGLLLCKAFRFPSLCGDSRTGWHEVRGNMLMLRYLTYMKVNAMPSYPVPLVQLPVDYCADISLKIFFDDTSPYTPYNIVPQHPDLEQDFPSVAAVYGKQIDIIEYEEFVEKIRALGENSPVYAFMPQYENVELIQQISTSPAFPAMEHYYKNNPIKFFYSEKLDKYCPDLYNRMETPLQALRRDMKYLKDKGIMEKFGV